MPHGSLSMLLRDALGDVMGGGGLLGTGGGGSYCSRGGPGHMGSLTTSPDAYQLSTHLPTPLRRPPISFAALGTPDAKTGPDPVSGAAPENDAEERVEDLWENLDGLPQVRLSSPSDAYISKDMAESPGQSHFKPSLGCKCGLTQAAPAHPEIDFRQGFLDAHPDFIGRVRRLQVHMEDKTDPRVVWDAEYDLRRFLVPGETPRLADTTPAIPRSGTRPRFMTFCPPEGGSPHNYELAVSATDHWGTPIEYFQGKMSAYLAAPPVPASPRQSFGSPSAAWPSSANGSGQVGQISGAPEPAAAGAAAGGPAAASSIGQALPSPRLR